MGRDSRSKTRAICIYVMGGTFILLLLRTEVLVSITARAHGKIYSKFKVAMAFITSVQVQVST